MISHRSQQQLANPPGASHDLQLLRKGMHLCDVGLLLWWMISVADQPETHLRFGFGVGSFCWVIVWDDSPQI